VTLIDLTATQHSTKLLDTFLESDIFINYKWISDTETLPPHKHRIYDIPA
jgi:hypothetical protein